MKIIQKTFSDSFLIDIEFELTFTSPIPKFLMIETKRALFLFAQLTINFNHVLNIEST